MDWLTALFYLAMIIFVCVIVTRLFSWIQFIRKVEEFPKNVKLEVKVPTINEIKDNPTMYVVFFKSYWGQFWYLNKETNQLYFYHKYYNEVKPYGELMKKI